MTTATVSPPLPVDFAASSAEEFFFAPQGEETIRAEQFGPEHLEAHARRLAAVSEIRTAAGGAQPLLDRFRQNRKLLRVPGNGSRMAAG
jgi:hypothetical protein